MDHPAGPPHHTSARSVVSRIEPGGRKDIGTMAWVFSRVAGRVTKTQPPAFITVLGRGRRQFWGWLGFAGSLMPCGSLPREETEAVILRVAHLTGCDYEKAHHQHLARRVGLSKPQIDDASGTPYPAAAWSSRELTILKGVNTLVTTGDLDDQTWQSLRSHLSEREAIEFVQLVGQYVMLSTTIRVLRIPPDRPKSSG